MIHEMQHKRKIKGFKSAHFDWFSGTSFVLANSVENAGITDGVQLLGYVLFGLYVLTALWLFVNALVQLHLLWHYKNKKKEIAFIHLPHTLPFVSIQVPVYNEKFVIERLLKTLARLDYPKEKWEIQVLDDSTDETSRLIDQQVQLLLQQHIQVQVLRRSNRKGFKAGALQYGLPFCKGDLIAIFDADFTPPPQFIKQLVPHFANEKVGLVQARWSHLNKEANDLTRIQSILLDTHFSVEQSGRAQAGYFINFCGTAGIWRKQCIVDAGGWDGDVLSEDLDLSYRAQLKGWQMVYNQQLEVPAELPAVLEAFKIQQFRWTKGMAQVSRKTIKELWQANLPFSKKMHGIFHLLSSFVFVCLFINALLTVPLLIYRSLYPAFITLTQFSLFTSINLVALTVFYYNGTKSTAHRGKVNFFSRYPLFLAVYMGLSVQNTVAVIQGLIGNRSAFIRTPKFNNQSTNHYLSKKFSWINWLELATLLYFTGGLLLSIYLDDYFMVLIFLMMGSGLAYLLYHSLERWKPKPTVKKAQLATAKAT
jgi:cellulose synthase/poly-beta-1,6-N-acetylglucosamine synthase-like glycosyltransferase